MFDLAQIVAYVLVVMALFLVPGPAVLLTLARSIGGAGPGSASPPAPASPSATRCTP